MRDPVNALSRIGLPVLGLIAFALLWQGVVVATRPAPILRVTLGFSAPREGRTVAVVLGERGQVLVQEALFLEGSAAATAAERLRILLGDFQPTLAALPPAVARAAGAAEPLRALIEHAKQEFGGGLDARELEVEIGAASDPAAEAGTRAVRLQLANSIHPSWLPGPAEAAAALAGMTANGEMLRHVVASVFRVATGFALATALGIPLGLALGSFAGLNSFANSIIQCLRPISPIAWLPVATLLLGGGDLAAIFLIFLASFFPIAVATAAAVAAVDVKYRRSALNFEVRGLEAARRVVVPAALPAILTGLRIALGVSWVVVVAAEMLGVESGLGYLVLDARNQLRYDRVVAAMIMIGLIGLAIDTTVRAFERSELERRGLSKR